MMCEVCLKRRALTYEGLLSVCLTCQEMLLKRKIEVQKERAEENG